MTHGCEEAKNDPLFKNALIKRPIQLILSDDRYLIYGIY
jgi:hypothetical protein